MTLTAFHTFLISTLEEGATIANRTNFSQSLSSRSTSLLATHHRCGKEGLNLIKVIEDPQG